VTMTRGRYEASTVITQRALEVTSPRCKYAKPLTCLRRYKSPRCYIVWKLSVARMEGAGGDDPWLVQILKVVS